VTVPAGLPPATLPVTVATSVSALPVTMVAWAGADVVTLWPVVTLKHSSMVASALEL